MTEKERPVEVARALLQGARSMVNPETRWMEFVIRLLLLLALIGLCLKTAAPFLEPALWGIILAVALRPLQHRLAKLFGGRPRLAAAVIGCGLAALVLVPAWLLAESVAGGLRYVAAELQDGRISLPALPTSLLRIPYLGVRLSRFWHLAATNWASMLEAQSSHLAEVGSRLLDFLGAAALAVGQFVVAAVIATVLLFRYEGFSRGAFQLARKLASERGFELLRLAAQTVRNVALGVMGVALVQTLLSGLAFSFFEVPGGGLLTLLVLGLCIVQVGPTLVLLPTTIWLFYTQSGLSAFAFLAISVLIVVIDNVLKPLIFGRGSSAPMLVVFMGALGGLMQSGLIGLFTGAVLLVLGYELLKAWMDGEPAKKSVQEDSSLEAREPLSQTGDRLSL